MKSWQEMKDFSYVGIKLTKAKTISEGLTKCKIQKLTRQNPIYEHIKLHQLIKNRKPCPLCSSLPPKHSHKQKSPASQGGLSGRGQTAPLKQSSTPQLHKRQWSQRENSQGHLQKQALNEFDRLQGVIERFDSGMRRTRSQFSNMQQHSRITTRYFVTEAEEITQQLDEDRTELVRQVKSVRMHLLEEEEEKRKHQKQVDRKVKELNKPVHFPLDQDQMEAIVEQAKQRKEGAVSKLNRLICSLYDYKAKANYSNKMKIIKQYNK